MKDTYYDLMRRQGIARRSFLKFCNTYMVFREDITRGSTVISTMINGIRMFKREPEA